MMEFVFPESRKEFIRDSKTLLETYITQAPEGIRKQLAKDLGAVKF